MNILRVFLSRIGINKHLSFLFLASLSFSCSNKVKFNNDKMLFANFVEVESSSCDFGRISSNEHDKARLIKLLNTSKDTLIISSIPIACSCLSAKYSNRIILPNDSFSVELMFHPMNKQGYFKRAIMLVLNNGKYYYIFNIKGVVE